MFTNDSLFKTFIFNMINEIIYQGNCVIGISFQTRLYDNDI